MNVVRRLLRSVLAVAALLIILVGVPVALWFLGLPFLPTSVPSFDEVVVSLGRPDDGRLLLGFLVLIGVGAWLMLAFSILAEIASVLARRPVLRVGLPGFGLGRSVAAALVAAVVGAGPAIAEPVAVASSSWSAPEFVDQHDTPPGPVHVVAARDTLWRLAETALGDPMRWREIFDLNVGRVQADGGWLTDASLLNVGWELRLPTDARDTVRVQPGDTLTELAGTHLGDPARFGELFALNEGAGQPDGSALVDPDLLRPGWTLTLPDADDAGTPPGPVSGGEPVTPAVPPLTSGSPTTTSPPPPSTTADPTPTATAEPPEPAAPGEADHADTGLFPVTIAGVSTLVIAGVASAVLVRRRRQLRNRAYRHRVAVPSDEAGRVEWLATHDNPVVDIEILDAALRSLSLANWQGVAAPALRCVQLDSDGAVLTLAHRTSLPPPFVAIGDEDEWTLSAEADLPIEPDEAGGFCAPFPLLVSVATRPDTTTLLLDLEQPGTTHIVGDPDRGIGLLRHIAAELATSAWAEDVEVLLVGFGAEIVALNPERLRVLPRVEDGIAEIHRRITGVRAAMDRLDIDSVVGGRLTGIAADSWLPTLLLVAAELDDDQQSALDDLAAGLANEDRAAVAVLVAGPTGAGAELRIDDTGLLHAQDLPAGPWRAESLTDTSGVVLADVLAPLDKPSVPVLPAERPERWAQDMNEDGTLGDITDPPDDPPPPPGPFDDELDDDDEPDDNTPAGPDPIPAPRPPADPDAQRRLHVVEYQDPHLDADLAHWHTDGPPNRPLIAILGEVGVRAPGELPPKRPSWFVEVLIYLSLTPAGISTSKALTDLWPEGQPIRIATVRHAFYGARSWAGRGLGGDPDVPFVSELEIDGAYRIRGQLLDWDLFCRLRKRAHARHAAGHPDAVTDYRDALNLVRGPVLSRLRPSGYAWLNNHDQRHDLQIPGFLIDTAHELVDLALTAGDTALARWAAERARTVDIDGAFDRPLTDLMRIAHAEDNQAEMELYAAVLLDARGHDVPEELPPETFAVINDLMPAGPRRPRP